MDCQNCLELLKDGCDEKVFVSKVFEMNNLLEPLKMVSERLSELDASISQHVSKHNSVLLSQAVDLETFSNIVGSVESHITNVSGNVNMIKHRLAKHYDHISTQVTLISRLGVAYETLQNVLRIVVTAKKLHASSDIVQASKCIEELDYAFNSLDWNGIKVLEEHHKDILKEKERVTKEAWESIRSSFSDGDHVRLGLSLQTFDNLSMLPKVIHVLVSDWLTDIEDGIRSAADVEGLNKRAKGKVISSLTSATPGRASLPSSGGHAAFFRNLLLIGLDHMVGIIERSLAQVRMLYVTLQKKRSSMESSSSSTSLFTGLCNYVLKNFDNSDERDCCYAIMIVLYTEETDLNNESVMSKIRQLSEKVDEYIAETYTNGLLGRIAACLSTVFEPALHRRSGQLKEALETNYPRLLKLFLNIFDRQQRKFPQLIENFLVPFETAYLSRCLKRLYDSVNSTFVGITTSESNDENLPRLIDAERLVQTAATELAHSVGVSHDLFCKVARNVAKMVALFSTKVEALIVTGPEAFQVTGNELPTPAQQKNANLVNFTCAFVDRLRMAVARHTTTQQHKWACRNIGLDDPQTIIDQAITSKLSDLCLSALQPLLKAITDYILDQILPRMHKEFPDGDEDSPYVQDLQTFINRMLTGCLTGFSVSLSATSNGPCSTDRALFISGEAALRTGLQTRVLTHCLDALAVHASLLRPCASEADRSRLINSISSIEMTLATLAPPCSSTEVAFSRLRALRQIFSLPTEDVSSVGRLQEVMSLSDSNRGPCLPGSLVIHHIIARSPEEIPLPHQTASGWSLERYIRWCLSTTDEAARLSFIRNAIDVYTEQVDARKQRSYPPSYLVIRDLLKFYQNQQKQ